MKTNKNKLTNFLKTRILLFGISLLLWNCNQNVGDEETFIPLTISKYQSLDIEETTSFLSDFKSKKYLKKSAKGINLNIDINSLKFENVENSELSMPVFEAITKHATIESKVFLIKVNDSIQGFLLNKIPKKDDNSSKFSGIISVTNLEGKFINAYRIENGDFITQFVKKTTSNNPVFHAKASDPEDCDESLDPSSEFCNQGLEEIVIVSNGGGNSNSNSNSNTGTGLNFNNSWGWSFPSSNIGGGGTGNSSNSSNKVNVFPCDDPIHGCDKENEEEEDNWPYSNCASFEYANTNGIKGAHTIGVTNLFTSSVMTSPTTSEFTAITITYPTLFFTMPSHWTNGRSATLTAKALDNAIDQTENWFRSNPTASQHTLQQVWFSNIKAQMIAYGGNVGTTPLFSVPSPAPYSTSWFPSNCG